MCEVVEWILREWVCEVVEWIRREWYLYGVEGVVFVWSGGSGVCVEWREWCLCGVVILWNTKLN